MSDTTVNDPRIADTIVGNIDKFFKIPIRDIHPSDLRGLVHGETVNVRLLDKNRLAKLIDALHYQDNMPKSELAAVLKMNREDIHDILTKLRRSRADHELQDEIDPLLLAHNLLDVSETVVYQAFTLRKPEIALRAVTERIKFLQELGVIPKPDGGAGIMNEEFNVDFKQDGTIESTVKETELGKDGTYTVKKDKKKSKAKDFSGFDFDTEFT